MHTALSGGDVEAVYEEMGPSRDDTPTSQLRSLNSNREERKRNAPVLRNNAESPTAIVSLGVPSDAVNLASNDRKRRIITKQVQ